MVDQYSYLGRSIEYLNLYIAVSIVLDEIINVSMGKDLPMTD